MAPKTPSKAPQKPGRGSKSGPVTPQKSTEPATPQSPLKDSQVDTVMKIADLLKAEMSGATNEEQAGILNALSEYIDAFKIGQGIEPSKSSKDGKPGKSKDGKRGRPSRSSSVEAGKDPESTDEDPDPSPAGKPDDRLVVDPAAVTAPVALLKVTVPLSDVISVQEVTDLRAEFVQRLLKVDVKAYADKLDKARRGRTQQAPRRDSFTDSEALRLGNFFFVSTLGQPALTRMQSLLKWYNDPQDGQPDLALRAKKVAEDQSLPKVCRDLFSAWAKADDATMKTNTAFRAIIGFTSRLEVRYSYNVLVESATKNRGGIRELFAEAGLKSSQGVSYTSLARQYIAKKLEVSNMNRVANMLQQANTIHELIRIWGPGMVVLLPPDFISFMQPFGLAKASAIADTLHGVLGDEPLNTICQILEKQVLDPIRRGKPIRLQLPHGSGLSLQHRVEMGVVEENAIGVDGDVAMTG